MIDHDHADVLARNGAMFLRRLIVWLDDKLVQPHGQMHGLLRDFDGAFDHIPSYRGMKQANSVVGPTQSPNWINNYLPALQTIRSLALIVAPCGRSCIAGIGNVYALLRGNERRNKYQPLRSLELSQQE